MKKKYIIIPAVAAVTASLATAGVLAFKRWQDKRDAEMYKDISSFCQDAMDAFDDAMESINHAPCSRKALLELLEAREYSGPVIEETMKRIDDVGFNWVDIAADAAEKIDEKVSLSQSEMLMRLTVGTECEEGLGFTTDEALDAVQVACIDWRQNALNAYWQAFIAQDEEEADEEGNAPIVAELLERGFTVDDISAALRVRLKLGEDGKSVIIDDEEENEEDDFED